MRMNRRGSPAATLQQVNRVAATRVSAATAERVRAAASELAYAPNLVARGLRRRRTNTIAPIVAVRKTTSWKSHDRRLDLAHLVDQFFANAVDVGNL